MNSHPDIGHIYILSNPSLVGILKIGYTKKSEIESRIVELSSSTSIPLPFSLENSWLVEAPSKYEALIHARLHFCRVSKDREFFRIGTEDAEAHINKILYGTEDPVEALKRSIDSLIGLYEKHPKAFTAPDDIVAKLGAVLGGLRQHQES